MYDKLDFQQTYPFLLFFLLGLMLTSTRLASFNFFTKLQILTFWEWIEAFDKLLRHDAL